MGFTHLIQREAGKTIDAIKTLYILEDIEVLEDTVIKNSFARKLLKVYKSSQIFTKQSKDAFIKLMNDSFLCFELTKSYYEALAKDDITA